jgi:hypothetical protein
MNKQPYRVFLAAVLLANFVGSCPSRAQEDQIAIRIRVVSNYNGEHFTLCRAYNEKTTTVTSFDVNPAPLARRFRNYPVVLFKRLPNGHGRVGPMTMGTWYTVFYWPDGTAGVACTLVFPYPAPNPR